MILNFSPRTYINGIIALGCLSENWGIMSDHPIQIFMDGRVMVCLLTSSSSYLIHVAVGFIGVGLVP